MSTRSRPRRQGGVRAWEVVSTAFVALLFVAAPTVGDIGSCGRQASDLDLNAFQAARKALDCRRCSECGLRTHTCAAACDPGAPSTVSWPSTCHPLGEDGDVCLRALSAAGCGDYTSFVDDSAPTFPSECDFCHLVPEGGIAPGDS